MGRKLTEYIVNLDTELQEEISKYHTGVKTKFVQVGEGKCLIPAEYKTKAEKYLNFEVRPDDIWICGIPRSGTTLTEQMVWYIINDVDFEKAKGLHTLMRTPYFEGDVEMSEDLVAIRNSPDVSEDIKRGVQMRVEALQTLDNMKDRRVIKTHLHFSLLPPEIFTRGCKVVYVARNPKDVMISYYHLQKAIPNREFIGSLKNFVDLYKKGLIIWTPYWSHIRQAWSKRESPNFTFIFYEHLVQDLKKGINEMSEFLERPLKREQIENLADALGFDKFKKFFNEEDSGWKAVDFVRKGKVGGWRDCFDKETLEDTNRWIEQNSNSIGIQYPES